jgi:NAD(P)-dependent dehydrogenase (short-subunit alcohol dehydrogenase family)
MTARPPAGKVAFVTASSRYLGAATATALARAGARTAIHYHHSAAQAQALVQKLRAEGLEAEAFGADGRNPEELRRAADAVVERFGGVDILVNNLGPFSDLPWLKLPEAQWDWILDTNLKAVYVLAQRLAPGMIERGWGRIVNISAVSAFIRSQSIYGLAKAAVIHLTEALALELAPHVTVNAIAPGQIEDSELIDEIDPRLKGILRDQSPLKRLVTYQEIAEVILLLCGGPFASMTGQTLTLDAGWSLPKWGFSLGPVEWEDNR